MFCVFDLEVSFKALRGHQAYKFMVELCSETCGDDIPVPFGFNVP